ncbi:MAG TPA: hypothetical protein VEV81_11760 [Pyrinomonadaceae bacterium]|nr:hypothetical protein [Pyrinomonadaceae bacterium]
MRKHIPREFFTVCAALCALLMLSAPIEAQRRRGPRQRGYTRAEVNEVIKRVENRSDSFVHLFDKSLDRSVLNGTNREDRLNQYARDLEKALDDLRHEFDRKESYIETRPEARRSLDIASDINVALRNRRLGAETERQWALLRAELNTLADVYNLPFVGSPEYF